MAKRTSFGINVRDFRLKQLKRTIEEREEKKRDTGKSQSERQTAGSHKKNTISVNNKETLGPSVERKGLSTAKKGFNKPISLAKRVKEDIDRNLTYIYENAEKTHTKKRRKSKGIKSNPVKKVGDWLDK